MFAISGFYESYWSMIISRTIFGLGGESMIIANSIIITSWFKGRDLNFAMGVNLSVIRIAYAVNGWVVPYCYYRNGLVEALSVGALICILSFIASILISCLDKKAEII